MLFDGIKALLKAKVSLLDLAYSILQDEHSELELLLSDHSFPGEEEDPFSHPL